MRAYLSLTILQPTIMQAFQKHKANKNPDKPLEKQTTKGYVISNGQQISNLCLFTESLLYLLCVLLTASASHQFLYSEDARLRQGLHAIVPLQNHNKEMTSSGDSSLLSLVLESDCLLRLLSFIFLFQSLRRLALNSDLPVSVSRELMLQV